MHNAIIPGPVTLQTRPSQVVAAAEFAAFPRREVVTIGAPLDATLDET